MAGAGAKEF